MITATTALLSVDESRRADKLAVRSGVTLDALMENAGAAIACEIERRWSPLRVTVLCGPGNNGGDGFVVARLLKNSGWTVRVALLGRCESLTGEAALNAGRWDGEVLPLNGDMLEGCGLVVDALFGAGLSRPLDGAARAAVEAIGKRGIPCVAVDVPSGIDGDSGELLGAAPHAVLTVTFCRRKPGHLLLPGRLYAGEVVVADIGIPEAAVDEIGPRCFENTPPLWLESFPRPGLLDHKYSRGHAVVVGGEAMTGAARLAARSGLRAGAGIVTVACPPGAAAIYAVYMPGVLTYPISESREFDEFLDDLRIRALLVGPGNGVTKITKERTFSALASGRPCVLDADALSVFEDDPDVLFKAIRGPCLLTPHEGEFRRLFSIEGDKLFRAREAARKSGAVLLLKCGDSVIAAPDGRAAIVANAPPDLATAGAGDVLAGIALGLLAQEMEPFEAAAAAAWIHGEAGRNVGPGLIAEDLPDALLPVLRYLRKQVGRDSKRGE
jgi:NAD(P)H-hydrate epimerase